ncbi:MAG TPA: phosphoesterase [Verrucomicrobiales bacterium]|nr:phosphoesterase [Verrucomicrobiales bacterium]
MPQVLPPLSLAKVIGPFAAALFLGCGAGLHGGDLPTESVGVSSAGRYVTPVSQILTPAGEQVFLPDMRPQGIALSPDGQLLVTSGKTAELVVLSPLTGGILQRVVLPPDPSSKGGEEPVSTHLLAPDTHGQLSFTGLIFSRDGRRIFLSNVDGSIKSFSVEGTNVAPLRSYLLPRTDLTRRSNDIPAGLALPAEGSKLYVALNLSNRLLELDLETGKELRLFDVGFAPYDVVLSGRKAYVSNWGGRRAGPEDLTGPGGRGTRVRVDPHRHIASEGSVSVVDLDSGRVVKEILVGLHPSALALHPDGRHLVVANAGSDSVSVIDVREDAVVETISLRWQPKDYFGASPNALTFDPRGRSLYVCNGTQNAVAVVEFRPGRSRLLGLIPVGWFPGALAYDAVHSKLHVANTKGIGSGRRARPPGPQSLNSHQYLGTVSLVPLPDRKQLVAHTRTVLANCRRERIEASQLPARPGQPPRPVPERAGEPSLFKHVIYIIKENRTYDQVLGDIREGNGDPKLCTFGEEITPNQHKMAREFVLLDNTYCSGILSADGHQWSTTAFATDYMEKSFAGFPRSYPDGMEDDDVDALAYSPAGFIWDNVVEHGKRIRDYGEFAIEVSGWAEPGRKGSPKWVDFYRDFLSGKGETIMRSRPAIESVRPFLNTNTVGWGMEIPDVYRAARFIEELQMAEKTGDWPDMMIVCLPNDHTSGTKAGAPTPAAYVADNDLAFGRIVDAVSHSRFWPETCIFAIEDDPQAGHDHVSGYRTTGYCVSPYTKRGKVISTQYNQPGLLRTMELILGLPPMNQMDAAATPMADCFVQTPDLRPYTAVTNRIPLDQLNPPAKAILNPVLRRDAELSERLPLSKPDQCDEDVLNRILWHAQKGPSEPYPKWALLPKRLRRDRD